MELRLKKDGTPMRNNHLVNLWQTKEERREKYWLLRSLGANSSRAAQMKDWRLTNIEKRFNLCPVTPTSE